MLPFSCTQFPIFLIHVLRSGLKASRHYSDTCTQTRWDNMMNSNITDPQPADFLSCLCHPMNHLGAGPSSHPSSLTTNPAVLSPAIGPGVLLDPLLSLLQVCSIIRLSTPIGCPTTDTIAIQTHHCHCHSVYRCCYHLLLPNPLFTIAIAEPAIYHCHCHLLFAIAKLSFILLQSLPLLQFQPAVAIPCHWSLVTSLVLFPRPLSSASSRHNCCCTGPLDTKP